MFLEQDLPDWPFVQLTRERLASFGVVTDPMLIHPVLLNNSTRVEQWSHIKLDHRVHVTKGVHVQLKTPNVGMCQSLTDYLDTGKHAKNTLEIERSSVRAQHAAHRISRKRNMSSIYETPTPGDTDTEEDVTPCPKRLRPSAQLEPTTPSCLAQTASATDMVLTKMANILDPNETSDTSDTLTLDTSLLNSFMLDASVIDSFALDASVLGASALSVFALPFPFKQSLEGSDPAPGATVDKITFPNSSDTSSLSPSSIPSSTISPINNMFPTIPVPSSPPMNLKGSPWPRYYYTCDIVKAFTLLHCDSGQTLRKNFLKIFGVEYVKSTYTDHVKRWREAPSEAVAKACSYGYTEDGLHGFFMKAVSAPRREKQAEQKRASRQRR
jgi:hypothetical protein